MTFDPTTKSMQADDLSPTSPGKATGVTCGELVRVPKPEERAANHRALSKLHVGNRFRLMAGMPLLPQNELNRRCLQCNREYDSNVDVLAPAGEKTSTKKSDV